MNIKEIEIGDRIKFKAVTRWSNEAVWRVVTAIHPCVCVRFGGWAEFQVRDGEIVDVEKR